MQMQKTQISDDGLKQVLIIPSNEQQFNVTFLRKFETSKTFKTIAIIQIEYPFQAPELTVTIAEFLETGFFNFRGVIVVWTKI